MKKNKEISVKEEQIDKNWFQKFIDAIEGLPPILVEEQSFHL